MIPLWPTGRGGSQIIRTAGFRRSSLAPVVEKEKLEIAPLRGGAQRGVDQLGQGGEDRAVVVGQFAVAGLCEPALDSFRGLLSRLPLNRGFRG